MIVLPRPHEGTPYHGQAWFYYHGIHGLNPRTLMGLEVQIEGGHRYRVLAVETFAVQDPYATGKPFGLLVTRVTDTAPVPSK